MEELFEFCNEEMILADSIKFLNPARAEWEAMVNKQERLESAVDAMLKNATKESIPLPEGYVPPSLNYVVRVPYRYIEAIESALREARGK